MAPTCSCITLFYPYRPGQARAPLGFVLLLLVFWKADLRQAGAAGHCTSESSLRSRLPEGRHNPDGGAKMQRRGAEHPEPEQRSPRRGFYGGQGSTTACSMGPAQPPQSRVRCCSVTAGCMGGLCQAPTYVPVKSQLKLCSLEWIFIATFLAWMPSLTGWGCQEAYNDLSKNVLWRHSKILWCFPAPCIPAAMRTKHWLDFILALHFIKQYMKRTKINQSENTEQSIQEPDNVSYTDANI